MQSRCIALLLGFFLASCAQAAWFEKGYTPQSYVTASTPMSLPEEKTESEALPVHGGHNPQHWIETSSVLTYAHEAATLLLNQDYRYLTSQKLALSHYFHPSAFSQDYLQGQESLEKAMLAKKVSVEAYALAAPQLDPTFDASEGVWQVLIPMHQRMMQGKKVVLDQDLAVRMRLQMTRQRDLSSWQVVHLEVKTMGDAHAQNG